jgi:hypothetical protein
MRVTDRTKSILACRRQRRELIAAGWDHVSDPVWEIDRGGRWDEVIIDVKIATDGKSLYVKTAKRQAQKSPAQGLG